MDAVDNPSYFTVPGSGKFSMLRRRGLGVGADTAGHSPPVSPTTALPSRRLSRTLLRSVSAQSDASLLVLGNPRLCDLAPAHRPSSTSDMLSPDDDGEVFLYPDGDARYYNLQAASKRAGGRRRHSFGEFLRASSTTSSQQQPLEPKKCHSSGKRCDKCSEKVTKSSELLDILIVSSKVSEAAALWVSYLTNCFQQVAKERSRQPFKLLCVAVEDVVNGALVGVQHDTMLKARLQLVILCPVFLQCVSVPGTALGSLFQPGHVLAMLLGVTDEDVTLEDRAAFLCYDQWQRQIVKDQDPMFVGDFLGTAMDILSRSWQLQQAINQSHKDENKALFSVLPKKIKMGQNKLLILLVNPLETTDNVQITIDKNGQKFEISSFKKRNPYTLQFVVPATCLQISMLMTVVVEKNGKPLGHRLVKCESRMRELDQLLRSSDNPLQFMCQTLGISPGDRDQLDTFLAAAFQQNMPPHFNLLRLTGLRHNSSCEEFPTLLHFAARHGLEKLSWHLLECAGGEQACQMRNTCQLTPTDLAEHAGHTRLAHTLKSFLQMTELSSMYSYLKGMSEKQANDAILNCSNYLLPRSLDNTYSIPPSARPVLSSPLPNTSQPSSPQPHQYTNIDSYQIPPSPVSVVDNFVYNIPSFPIPLSSPMDNYQVPGQAIPYNPPTPPTPSSPLDALPPGGYMEMQSPTGSNKVGSANRLRGKMTLNLPHHEYLNCPSSEFSNDRYFHSTEDILTCKSNEKRHRNSSHSSNSGKSSSISAQDELVEIINDFKNNVFTITEVEKLVESWQNRHDVQQSFKEKQKQLNEMREEYDKIQHAIKENMKRTTPFERIRKFFTKGKSKNCGGACKFKTVSGCSNSPTTAVNNRPPSSLSLHSSCSSTSSGRMSTGSGSSLGDSGTHSDSDERKLNENGKHDLRSKILSGKLYTEIPQRDPMKAKDDPESDRRDIECLGLSSGFNKPHFLYRSNSIQENTIEEEADETRMSKDQILQQQNIAIIDKETTMADVHNIPCGTCRSIEMVKETQEKLPLPPPGNSSIKGMETPPQNEQCIYKTINSIPEQLLIIEDNDVENINNDNSELIELAQESKERKGSHECDIFCKTHYESDCIKQSLQSDILKDNHQSEVSKSEDVDGKINFEQSTLECKSKGYVKSIVNIIENDNNLDILDASNDICEHILDSLETEVLFELPDYVNVTLPPVHPCMSCEDITA